MKMISPIVMTDAILGQSNVTETTTWSAGSTYAKDDEVEFSDTHRRYVSQQDGNTGNDPKTDDGTWWIDMGASNRWRAFDQRLGQSVTKTGTISYTLDVPTRVTGIGLLGVSGSSVRVRLQSVGPPVETVFDETRVGVDTIEIVDWFSYFTWEPEYETEFLFTDLPGFAGNRIKIDIDAGSGTAAVAQIVLGRLDVLGTTLPGTEVGIEDFSTKERDDFGNAFLVERAFADTVDFQFAVEIPSDPAQRPERRVRKRLAAQRATPTLYFADEGLLETGAMVFGYFQDFSIPLESAGVATCTLEVEGLT
ncbi:hypothetical protein [Leisingera sp. ANG-Vp]|uniref:hypothetical protein n=1 Tax=Leisingera sp. ANG-Vp TaxID=1577896 RepID=UPI00057E6D41|nr:hypothetical protein [Leisingera sp. ANG-Vp]KIC22513.1 hypothetical protein RA20_01145 [Leisingera sp. ANG-Vp]